MSGMLRLEDMRRILMHDDANLNKKKQTNSSSSASTAGLKKGRSPHKTEPVFEDRDIAFYCLPVIKISLAYLLFCIEFFIFTIQG